MISLRMPEPLKRPVSCFQRCAPQEFIGRSLRLEGAVIDQEALVGVLGAQVQVVHDHHDPSVSLPFEPGPDAPHEPRRLMQIQPCAGLVEHKPPSALSEAGG